MSNDGITMLAIANSFEKYTVDFCLRCYYETYAVSFTKYQFDNLKYIQLQKCYSD